MLTRTRLLTAVTPLYLRDADAALAMSQSVDLPLLCSDIITANPEHAMITAAELEHRFVRDFHMQCGFEATHLLKKDNPELESDVMICTEESLQRSKAKLLLDLAEAFATISLFLTHLAPTKFVVMNTWSSRRFLYYFWAWDIKKVSLALNDKLFSKLPLPALPVAFLQPCQGDSYLEMLSVESNRIFTSNFRVDVLWRGPRPLFRYIVDEEERGTMAKDEDSDYIQCDESDEEVEEEYQEDEDEPVIFSICKPKPGRGQPRPAKAGSLKRLGRGRGRPSLLCKDESFDLLNAQINMEHGEKMEATGGFSISMLKSSIETIAPMLLGLGEDAEKINKINVAKFGNLVVTRVFNLSKFSHELKTALKDFGIKTEFSDILQSLPLHLNQELDERCPSYLRFAIPNLLTRIKTLSCMREVSDNE